MGKPQNVKEFRASIRLVPGGSTWQELIVKWHELLDYADSLEKEANRPKTKHTSV